MQPLVCITAVVAIDATPLKRSWGSHTWTASLPLLLTQLPVARLMKPFLDCILLLPPLWLSPLLPQVHESKLTLVGLRERG